MKSNAIKSALSTPRTLSRVIVLLQLWAHVEMATAVMAFVRLKATAARFGAGAERPLNTAKMTRLFLLQALLTVLPFLQLFRLMLASVEMATLVKEYALKHQSVAVNGGIVAWVSSFFVGCVV